MDLLNFKIEFRIFHFAENIYLDIVSLHSLEYGKSGSYTINDDPDFDWQILGTQCFSIPGCAHHDSGQ